MILIIGYGSLMSYYGIYKQPSTRDIEIFNPFIVRFKGLRRFNTIGRRYMDIGKEFNPKGVQVDIDDPIDKLGNNIECLAYYVKEEGLQKIGIREGYPNRLLERIKKYNQKEKVQEGKRKLAEILWTFYPELDISASYHEKICIYRKKLGDHIHYE